MYVVNDFILSYLTHSGQCYHLIPIVSAWVLIPQANHKPVFCPHPQTMKTLTNPPRQTKSPDNSNMLNMFNSKDQGSVNLVFPCTDFCPSKIVFAHVRPRNVFIKQSFCALIYIFLILK